MWVNVLKFIVRTQMEFAKKHPFLTTLFAVTAVAPWAVKAWSDRRRPPIEWEGLEAAGGDSQAPKGGTPRFPLSLQA